MGLAMKLEPSCGQRMPRRPPYTRLVLATAAATWLCGHVALQLQPVFVAMAPANRLAPATGTLARARTAMFGHMMAARTTYEDLDPEVRELAERVNELLETGGARMWRTYCKTELKSQVFDPRRQSVENLRSFLDFYRPDLQELKRLFKIQPPSVYLFKQFIFDQDMSVNSQLTDVPPPWVRKFLNMYNEGDVYEVTVASAALQAEVKELTKDSTSYMAWHWKKFCFQRSFGVSMPDAVPAEIIKNFLKEYHAGSFGELAMTDDELTSQVNEVLRAGGGDAWRTFVDEQEVESMRNPKRFPAYIVRDFLSQIEFEDEDDNSGFTP
ncbi:unnamed protein product [Polarella glacialis]|uniref:Uncharacterized protein n=4 Tax=Polarella glacialis TaxID=89957 RepID=A0A813DNJ5_POLGL|nr:unnamed protein product [Polarella glacialis]